MTTMLETATTRPDAGAFEREWRRLEAVVDDRLHRTQRRHRAQLWAVRVVLAALPPLWLAGALLWG